MRVLLLEDDGVLAEAMSRRLQRNGLAVDLADTVDKATWLLTDTEYDCLVIDRVVPGGDALELLEKLRLAQNVVPALIVTGKRTEVRERVAGFEAGADDYLVKPFSLDEFTARVQALVRRKGEVRPPVLQVGDLVLDTGRRHVSRAGVTVSLTAKEFAILELMMRRPSEVIVREELIEHCWGERESPFSNVVDVHVASLRRKIAVPGLILTHRGVGYSLDPQIR